MRANWRDFYPTCESAYHAFVDKSRRKPYLCGICGRDITDPFHQPSLPGTVAIIASRFEEEETATQPIPEERLEPQLSLF